METEIFDLPELYLPVIITHEKGKPVLFLTKKIRDPMKIKILAQILLNEQFIPTKIIVKDKLKFSATLKQFKIID